MLPVFRVRKVSGKSGVYLKSEGIIGKRKLKTRSEVKREKRSSVCWRVGWEFNIKKKKKKGNSELKIENQKKRKPKERSGLQVETFLFVKILCWPPSSDFSGN